MYMYIHVDVCTSRRPLPDLRGPPPVPTHPVVGRASVGARARRLSSAPACVCVTRETRLSLVPYVYMG